MGGGKKCTDAVLWEILLHLLTKILRSKIQAVEMSYLRGGCGVNRMDGESNENVYRKLFISSRGEGMSCGVVEMVKRSTLRWFVHL